MDFITTMKTKAQELQKTIVLPETDDERVLRAAEIAHKKHIAKIILIGNQETINKQATTLGISLSEIKIINPEDAEITQSLIASYQKKREKKGMTLEQAKEVILNDRAFFGTMLVAEGHADGMVAGAVSTTAQTLRAMIQCVGTKPGTKSISSFFAIISPDKEIGYKGVTFFADCGVIPNPDIEQLADIAEATADNFKKLTGQEPKVAFLSFSTKGSAETEDTKKTVEALKLFQKRRPDILADGELQLDAAIVESVGSKKAPGSKVAGKANVLIFPNLEAGNIGYKLAQRFGKAEALGPLLQGANQPVNDLSRGCVVEDIVNVIAITAVQVS